MPNQPDHEHRGEPQFPDTPEGRRSRRNLAAWFNGQRRQVELEQDRELLIEKINTMNEEHRAVLTEMREQTHGLSAMNLLAVAADLFREMTAMIRQQREMEAELRELRNHPFEREVKPSEQPVKQPSRPKTKRAHVPQIKAWRTYGGFRDNMRERERAKGRSFADNGIMVPIELADLAGDAGGDSLRTITRTMEDYGLDPNTAGLPSAWPDKQPPPGRSIDGHPLAAMVAVIPIVTMLDAVIGGRLDGVVHLSKLLGCFWF